jgi:amino acid adenylation domain-containing protein/non-ribosomal peptide synthase protein (TIGR01720 family)
MNLKDIEDFYPLSPLQEGMLFHSLYQPEVRAYINTFSNGLQGALDVTAFQHAWQQVVNRHQALRSIFVHEGLKQPLQFVYRKVTLSWEIQDWRALSSSDQQEQLNAFLLADRGRGFDLSKPPLMRFALLQIADDHWHFVWTFHHILLDGWCLSLLLSEVFAFYHAYTLKQQLQLPRPRPYRDYIRWLQKQDLGAAETYWRKRLKGLSAPTTLEVGDQRKAQDCGQSYAERSRDFSEQTSRAIEVIARQQQVTVNTVIQGAWALLMSRYSGERDVLYGITVSGRPAELSGVEQMVGLFINALPMRVQVEGDVEVGAWLQRLQVEQAEMRQYEYSPLVEVQGWSEVERGVSLFETLLAYENFPTIQAQRGDSNSAAVSLSVTQGRNLERTNYALSVVVTPGVCMSVRALFEEHKFSADTVGRMLQHFEQLLAGMATNAQQQLAELQLLTEAETQQLGEWNYTQTAYPSNSCVHELIEAQAARTPDAIAVVSGKEKITHAELNSKANQLARHLRSLGVGPNVLVGICVERSIEMLVGLLGIWKAGGAYVALDPSYPQERLALMMREARVPVLLTQHKLLSVLPEHHAQVVCLDSDWPTISQQGELNLGIEAGNQHLAYVIYTSGSTGTPKGAGVYHQGLVNTFNWFINDFEITANDRILLMTSLSFDLTQKNIFTPLMVGGTLYLTPAEDVNYDPTLIADLVAEHEITLLNCTPSAFYPLIDNGDYDSLIKLVSLRHLFLGGEPISRQRLASWTEFFEFNTSIVNTYGPTECTDIVAFHRLDTSAPEDAVVPVGRPIFNTELFVLDQDLNLLPVGIAGELCVGGDGVGAGYINDSRLTASKFVPNPFSATSGARLYRTGDRARYLPDGNIEFLGRSDHQVKVRGFRIEIGEIEAALNEHPMVRESVVVAQDDPAGDKRLVAYVVAEGGPSELRKYLADRIPDYMVPSAFIQLDQIPLTPNGKVDRQALISYEEVAASEPESNVAKARNPIEELLVAIWAEVLGLKQVGVTDNFFELGGHSLVATQVISRISETFKIELPFRAFFDAPTIDALALYVEEALRSQHAIAAPPLVPVDREQALPLSFSQQRLWFLDQLEPNSNAYNIPSVVRLRGAFIPSVFKKAVEEVVRRHESLRTRFMSDEGLAWQQIDEAAALEVPVLDLRYLGGVEQDDEVRRLATLEVGRPFDLTSGPLLRLTVLQTADDEHVLMLTMHHIVSDGWSMTVLMRELIVLYDAFSRGEASPLPELAIQYADYAVWQREWLKGEVLEQQMKYWRQQLQGAPPVLELPADHPRPAVQTLRGRMLQRRMSGELLQQLEALSRREGLTMYMSVLAAFVVMLSRYSGQNEIVVGTPIAGRNRRDIEGLIGFFVNTLVLRVRIEEQDNVRQLLERVREVCLGGYTHQDVAFEQLVEELQPERDLSHQPLFQVMFALEGGGDEQGWKIGDLEVELEEVESGVAKFDLTLRVKQGKSGWELAMEYKQDLYEEATIACMLEHVERVLEGMVGDVRRPVSELSLLNENDRNQLLKVWNKTERDYNDEFCVPQLFEVRAAEEPDAIAVICEGEQLDYEELNKRSNQLAGYLRELGVGPEVVVGLCVEKSVAMVVGLLGILKAGGAYLPLDPEYPEQRLSFMLEDANVRVLLTQDHLLDRIPTAIRTVSLDGEWETIAERSGENLEPLATSANLAYIIYTSGSTGQPKGVMLNHKGLTNRSLTMIDQYGIRRSDRQFQFISLSFDASVEEIFPTLCRGAALVLRRNIKDLSPVELLAECGQLGVTKIDLPVSYWHQMVDELSQSEEKVPASFRTIVVGGDSPSTEKAKAFTRAVDHSLQLFNAYGPTEATVLAALYDIPLAQDELGALGKIPIGRPINNTRLYILDNDLKPVPARVFGELYIGGEGLARGYINRPDASAEKFIPDPFSEDDGARLYRTGDIARYLPNGDIEFAGRIDQQVKVRGFRIELSEIENLLLGHPALANAAVSLQERGGNKSVVAYVVPQAGVEVVTSELRRYLQQRLPEYMVPSVYMVLTDLPLTPSGKVDRNSLPVPTGVQPELDHEYVKPRTEVEETLAAIWAKMLGLERVGIHDNFFELGGDSILSIQVISRANHAGLRLSPKDLFQHQTVAKLAAVAGSAVEVVAEQGLVTGAVELTPIQRWFFEKEISEPHHFNQSLLLEVRQAIDPDLLGQAVRLLVLHHDALRLRFEKTEAGWQQKHVDFDEQGCFTKIDLSGASASEQRVAIEVEAALVQASLNLTAGPLFRVVYFDLGAKRPGRILLVGHHLVVDGVSWRILLADLQEAYSALVAGEPVQLPAKSSSFQQWSTTLKEHANSSALQQQIDYWLSTERTKGKGLPRDYVGGENLVSSNAVVVESLSREETDALLQDVPAVYHTHINEVLLSGLALALSQWTGESLVLVDMEGHGRESISERTDISRTVGWFTSVYPVSLEITGDRKEIGEVVKEIKEQVRRVPGQGLGYGVLRYLGGNKAGEQLARLPQAEVSFNYLGQMDRVLDEDTIFGVAQESSGPYRAASGRRFYLLEINSMIAGGQLQVSWSYSDQIHREETIAELAAAYMKGLRAIIEHCTNEDAGGYTPSDFPLAQLDNDRLEKLSLLLQDIDQAALTQ